MESRVQKVSPLDYISINTTMKKSFFLCFNACTNYGWWAKVKTPPFPPPHYSVCVTSLRGVTDTEKVWGNGQHEGQMQDNRSVILPPTSLFAPRIGKFLAKIS